MHKHLLDHLHGEPVNRLLVELPLWEAIIIIILRHDHGLAAVEAASILHLQVIALVGTDGELNEGSVRCELHPRPGEVAHPPSPVADEHVLFPRRYVRPQHIVLVDDVAYRYLPFLNHERMGHHITQFHKLQFMRLLRDTLVN